MRETQPKERWVIGCFILLSGIILFFNLWGRSLENHGYIRYAEVAREMIRSGEWVVPHWNGKIFIDKPPLLFWLIAIPSFIYGSVTPFLARLPSALSAWIGVVILFLWSKRIYGTTQAGLISGGILLSSYQYFFQSRLAKTELLLCLMVILSLYFFYLGYHSMGRKRLLFFCSSFFFMGLGVLTKGPFGLLPFVILSVYLIKERKWKIWFSKEFIMGYIVLVLTVLPWVFLFINRVGLEQTLTILKENRILTRTAPFYIYFVQIWGQFSPWSLFLPFLFIYLWKEGRHVLQSRHGFFLIWFISLLILLTVFKYRASRYLLPALPPLALMIGGLWKKRLMLFILLFTLAVSTWYIREIIWVKRDVFYSPGMNLVKELKPFLKEATLFAYHLDVSTLEEINFYLDPQIPIPVLKGVEYLKKPEKGMILMPKEFYDEKMKESYSFTFLKEFHYKKGMLVLISR